MFMPDFFVTKVTFPHKKLLVIHTRSRLPLRLAFLLGYPAKQKFDSVEVVTVNVAIL